MSIQSTLSFRSVDGIPLQWREVWWSTGTDPQATLDGWYTVTNGQSLLAQRQSFLSKSAEIYKLKCTNYAPGQPKNSVVNRLFPTLRGSAGVSDFLAMSIAFQLTIPGHRRGLSIRGIPDTWVEDNQLTTAGKNGIVKIISGMKQANGKVQGLGSGYLQNLQNTLSAGIYINTAPSTYRVTEITGGGNELLLLKTDPVFLATIKAGDLVVITACPSMPLLRATWKVGAIDGTAQTLTLAGSSQLAAIPGATASIKAGTASVDTTGWQINVVGPAKRDTGRPTDGPRGRRSARLRHR